MLNAAVTERFSGLSNVTQNAVGEKEFKFKTSWSQQLGPYKNRSCRESPSTCCTPGPAAQSAISQSLLLLTVRSVSFISVCLVLIHSIISITISLNRPLMGLKGRVRF